MAKKKGRSRSPKGSRKGGKKSNAISNVWYALAGTVGFAAAVQLTCISLDYWWILEPFSVTRYETERPNVKFFHASNIGLFIYDWGESTNRIPLNQYTQELCRSFRGLQNIMAGIDSVPVISSGCSPTCRQHFITRCNVFENMTTLGYATIGCVSMMSLAALIGVGWLFMYGVNATVINSCWLGGSAVSAVMMLWWAYNVNFEYDRLTRTGIMPNAKFGAAAYGCFCGCGLVILCGIVSIIWSWYQSRLKWLEKKAKIRQKAMEMAGLDDGSLPSVNQGASSAGGSQYGAPSPSQYGSPSPSQYGAPSPSQYGSPAASQYGAPPPWTPRPYGGGGGPRRPF